MSITEIAIKRPILFIVFFLLVTGFGVMSYKNLKYELLPELVTPFVSISTTYQGASPKEVEDAVTKKIEESVSGVSKVKRITSQSSENISVVTIEFTADADIDQAAQETQRAVSKALPEFPTGVKSPSIEKLNVNDLPILRMGITSKLSETALSILVKNEIKSRLNQVKNIGRITIMGSTDREINIAVKPEKLAYYNIPITDISEAVHKYNSDFPIGNIKDKDIDLGLRLKLKSEEIAALVNIPIKSVPNAGTIYLKDVAEVKDQTKEPVIYARVNRKNSVGLFITKQTGSNAIELAEGVKQALAEMESDYKNIGLKFTITQDSSEYTLEAANAVYIDFFFAVFLVALVMVVFLHSIRNAIIVMVAIPTSLFCSFIFMYFMGYTLNLMTLLAMSLVIGVLVDDSIVVLENIYRHLEMGKDKEKASLEGRNEIGFAALSITLVDVVVFLPLAFLPGLVGSLISQFSLVIVVSTLASLLVSFTLTPMISARFAKLEHPNPNTFFGKISHFFEHQIKRLTDWYVQKLDWCLNHKLVTILATIALLVSSFGLLSGGFIGSEFAPAADKGEMSLLINMQPGTKLSTTAEAVKSIEEKIKKLPEVEKVFSTIGYQANGSGEFFDPNVAAININLVASTKREKTLKEMGRQVRVIAMEEAGVKARVSPVGMFGAEDAPISLLLKGKDRDSLSVASQKLLTYIQGVKGTTNVRLSAELGKAEYEIVVDKEKAAQLGINTNDIGNVLRNAINGFEDLKLKTPTGEIEMRIQFEVKNRDATEKLKNYTVLNSMGQLVYLNQFTKMHLVSTASTLERRNKEASISVIAQASGRAVGDIGDEIRTNIEKVGLPKNIAISYEGDLELQDDSFGKLGLALLTSFILIYLIMVALYNNWSYPFVVLFSIPVALVGAFLALALTNKSLNVFSIFAIIMMMGLVAKNAILLVDRTNEARAEGMSIKDAILNSGLTRLRPILMTTLAMVIGMLPLALSKGAGAEVNSGMAWVLIGGLSSSMFLTLVFVPVIYYLTANLLTKFKKENTVKNNSKNNSTMSSVPKTLGVLLLLTLPFGTLKAQTQDLSIQQAIQLGMTNNINVQTSQLEQLKSSYLTQEAKSYLYPNITGGFGYTRNIKPPVFFFPSIENDPTTGMMVFDDKKLVPVVGASKNAYDLHTNLSIPIFNKPIKNNIAIAKTNELLQNENSILTKIQVENEIKIAYYNILSAESQKIVADNSIINAKQNLNYIRSRYTQGLVSPTDTLAVYINAESLKTALISTETFIKQAKNHLKYLIGLPLGTNINLTDKLAIEDAPTAVDSINYTQRPEYRINTLSTTLAKQQLKLERSRLLPDLQFVSQYQILTQSDNFEFNKYEYSNIFNIGIQLNVPIFDGWRTRSKIQYTQAQLRQNELQELHLKTQIDLEIQNAIDKISEARINYDLQTKLMQVSERNVSLITDRWKQGLLRYIEVADAELGLIKSKINQVNAIHQYQLARIEYEKAIGKSK